MLKWIYGCICKKNNLNWIIINCIIVIGMLIIFIISLIVCLIFLGFLCMFVK